MTSSNGRLQLGCNTYLVNSKSNCDFCIVFRDLLFSNTSYGSKIDEMRDFLKKKLPYKLFILILKIIKPDRAKHLDTFG